MGIVSCAVGNDVAPSHHIRRMSNDFKTNDLPAESSPVIHQYQYLTIILKIFETNSSFQVK